MPVVVKCVGSVRGGACLWLLSGRQFFNPKEVAVCAVACGSPYAV